jgi:protein TonB
MKQNNKTRFLFLSILFFLSCFSLHAQTLKDSTISTPVIVDDAVFTKVEVDAQFPGGIAAWSAYLIQNLNADIPVKNGAPLGRYRVIIRFIVSKDGSISEIQPETNYGYGMEEEAIKQIKNGPKWTPAMQNGRPVNAYKRQPITFVVQKG